MYLFIIIPEAGLQIYGGPGSLSHDFKIWPITFQGSGPSGPILLCCSASDFFQEWWAQVTHGAKNGGGGGVIF